jgi:hypothetical protein
LAQADQVAVGHASVLGRVLTHGRDHDAIDELKLSHLDRRAQFYTRHRLSSWTADELKVLARLSTLMPRLLDERHIQII